MQQLRRAPPGRRATDVPVTLRPGLTADAAVDDERCWRLSRRQDVHRRAARPGATAATGPRWALDRARRGRPAWSRQPARDERPGCGSGLHLQDLVGAARARSPARGSRHARRVARRRRRSPAPQRRPGSRRLRSRLPGGAATWSDALLPRPRLAATLRRRPAPALTAGDVHGGAQQPGGAGRLARSTAWRGAASARSGARSCRAGRARTAAGRCGDFTTSPMLMIPVEPTVGRPPGRAGCGARSSATHRSSTACVGLAGLHVAGHDRADRAVEHRLVLVEPAHDVALADDAVDGRAVAADDDARRRCARPAAPSSSRTVASGADRDDLLARACS